MPDKEASYIIYLDANNEYGWAMSQPLPVGNFRWTRKLPTEKEIMSWRVNRRTDYFLEVDLEYPQELHDKHNSYPLAPETTQVPEEWYSPYQKELAEELSLSKDKTEKLLLTLRDKKNYVLYYCNLQLYLSLGMKLKKVHNVLAFEQKDWMESYIRLNTELRKKATSDFEKNFFKLMNNSVFGKTMENLRNRTIVNLVRANEEKKLRQLRSDPLLSGESLAGIQMHKDHILMNRPIYILIYPKFCCMTSTTTIWSPNTAQTASFSIQTLTLSSSRSRPRTSTKTWERIWITTTQVTFRKATHCTAKKHKKVLGKMKDECAGALILEAVCLALQNVLNPSRK